MIAADPQPAVPKPKRRWYQYSLRSLLLFVTLASIGMSWVAWELKYGRRYPNKSQGFDHGNIMIHSVYCAGPWDSPGKEKLVYAFARTGNLALATTNYCPSEPARQGIHWWCNHPDGLWINGKKASLPAVARVFAILNDGVIVPIPLTDVELGTLAREDGTITDIQLIQKLRAPFQNKVAGKK